MKCPTCLSRIKSKYSSGSYHCYNKSCGSCSVTLNQYNKCIHYDFFIGSHLLVGSQENNFTRILEYPYFKIVFDTKWISINLNNLPENIPKLYNKLMKLRVFA